MPKKRKEAHDITLAEVMKDKRYRLQVYGSAALTDDGIIPFDTQLAIISHYLHNQGTREAATYARRAPALIDDICAVKFGEPQPPADGTSVAERSPLNRRTLLPVSSEVLQEEAHEAGIEMFPRAAT